MKPLWGKKNPLSSKGRKAKVKEKAKEEKKNPFIRSKNQNKINTGGGAVFASKRKIHQGKNQTEIGGKGKGDFCRGEKGKKTIAAHLRGTIEKKISWLKKGNLNPYKGIEKMKTKRRQVSLVPAKKRNRCFRQGGAKDGEEKRLSLYFRGWGGGKSKEEVFLVGASRKIRGQKKKSMV